LCCSTPIIFAARQKKRWNLDVNASSAVVDYLPGESQPGNWLNGVGGGILYHSPSDRWKIMLTYAYGIDAIRSDGRGANSIGMLLQWIWEKRTARNSIPRSPNSGAAGSGSSIESCRKTRLAQNVLPASLLDGCAYGGIGRHATLRW
jgi:hypothetical protein